VLFTSCRPTSTPTRPFGFGGNIYGATFFMATGFHGFHVIVGTIFLIVCLFRAMAGHFTPEQHFGFEAAAWYWHFVDVVWLFLFACIYVWAPGRREPTEHSCRLAVSSRGPAASRKAPDWQDNPTMVRYRRFRPDCARHARAAGAAVSSPASSPLHRPAMSAASISVSWIAATGQRCS
jgi:hypothetical protein